MGASFRLAFVTLKDNVVRDSLSLFDNLKAQSLEDGPLVESNDCPIHHLDAHRSVLLCRILVCFMDVSIPPSFLKSK